VLCITNKSTPDVQGEINEANISISGQSLIATLYSSQECKDGSWSRDVQKTKSTFRLDYYYFIHVSCHKQLDMEENREGQRHDRTALVLYGSETGNSHEVAEELGRVAERLHFVTQVCEMDQVTIV
jgi:sulfite reductase alpha subunit-like flavoprotein